MPLLSRESVLVAAGDAVLSARWCQALSELGLEGEVAPTAEALSRAAGCNHLLLHCPSFPGAAIETLAQLREEGYEGQVIAVTDSPSISEAVALVSLGCHDYLPGSLPAERVARHLAEGLGRLPLTRPPYELLWRSFRKRTGLEHLHSASAACCRTYVQAAQAAPSEVTVLVEGETGTGKEFLTRALHFMSPRRDKPFVAVNCGAIPESLLESELFGHERGAFTSATRAKPGLCEVAHRGTLFLDEVGDMSAAMQVKLLRFLQDRSFVRVGGVETVTVDVRIVAATNQNLHQAVRQGRFREDLYYRLAVLRTWLPPLRERREDIPHYARFFLRKHTAAAACKELGDCALQRLQAYHWPGNLRELENVIQRSILTSPYRNILGSHIDFGEPALAPSAPGAGELMLAASS